VSFATDILFTPTLTALLSFQALFVLGGAACLVLRVRALPGRFLGLAASPLTPSALRASELFLAAAFGFGGAFIVQQIVAVAAGHYFPPPADGTLGFFHVLAGGGFQLGLLAGLAHAWFWHLRPERRIRILPPVEPSPPHAPAAPGFILRGGFITFLIALTVVGPTSLLWQGLLDRMGIDTKPQDMITLFSQTGDAVALAFMIVLAVLVAPLTEELAFRVGLFRWLRTRTFRGVALFGPAIVFAAIHGNLAVLLPLAVLAVILSLGYEHYGHPAVPILAHALFNLNTIALLLAGLPA
jgi:hypothetical protein